MLKMYIQRLNYLVFPMKTSEAFKILTKCVEDKSRVPLGKRKLNCTLTKAAELYFTFCVIWGYHAQNSTTQTVKKIET